MGINKDQEICVYSRHANKIVAECPTVDGDRGFASGIEIMTGLGGSYFFLSTQNVVLVVARKRKSLRSCRVKCQCMVCTVDIGGGSHRVGYCRVVPPEHNDLTID